MNVMPSYPTERRLLVSKLPTIPSSLLDDSDEQPLAVALAYYRVSTSEQANTSFDDEGFSIVRGHEKVPVCGQV
jgi:hypothetical protein